MGDGVFMLVKSASSRKKLDLEWSVNRDYSENIPVGAKTRFRIARGKGR